MSPSRGRPRGRPAMIGRDQIVDVASRLDLADMTVRDVAEELGVSIPSLYHYFASRDALLAAAADRLMGGWAFPNTDGLTWTEWLRETSTALRALLLRHPGLADVVIRARLDGPHSDPGRTHVVTVLAEHYGLPADLADKIFTAITGPVLFSVATAHSDDEFAFVLNLLLQGAERVVSAGAGPAQR